jgi:mono/diheme cytochrome c family protein
MIASRILQLVFLSSLLMACSESADTGNNMNQIDAMTHNNIEQPARLKVDEGEQIYESFCLPCHAQGPGHPGTMRLAIRLGKDKAVLTQRDDLQIEYVKTIVRQGIMLMPPFRPSEITDAELLELATYLAPGTEN